MKVRHAYELHPTRWPISDKKADATELHPGNFDETRIPLLICFIGFRCRAEKNGSAH
jgi:hypothetical protein